MNSEPVVVHAAIATLATIAVAAAARWGVNLSVDQVTALLGVVAPLFTMAAAYLARRKVTPTSALLPNAGGNA